MTLEEQIKKYRKQAGLSQEKMAEKIGVSRQAITKWENGTGIPDITNLIAIAELFQISLDELLSNEKTGKEQAEYLYESRTEYDIDGVKNFDIKLGGASKVVLESTKSEKISVLLYSNIIKELQSDYKVKIDDIKNRIDVEVARLNGSTEAMAKEGLVVNVQIPGKYTRKIEVAVNSRKVDITNIEAEILELDGKISEIELNGNKGDIEINSNMDMQVGLLSHEGSVEINQVSATSRICIPDDYKFRASRKGIATSIFYEKAGKRVDDFSTNDAENYIELNGMKSELIIASGKEA